MQKGHNTHDHLGSISIIPLPADNTEGVRRNNHWGERVTGDVPHFSHILYIIKENRTYDQVLGDLGRGDGDPNLCVFGRDVTPNTHALAEQYVTLDNFYTCCVLSADGHNWTDEAYATEYLEKFFGGWVRSYGDDPLSYAASGFLWNNARRHGLTVRNYGEGLTTEVTPKDLDWQQAYAQHAIHHAEPYLRLRTGPSDGSRLSGSSCWNTGSMARRRLHPGIAGRRAERRLAQPDGHVAAQRSHRGTKPGLPTPRAQVADNDLALGRIVDAVSHSRFWKDTAIFVVEDDSQSGLDHVEAHRTVALSH